MREHRGAGRHAAAHQLFIAVDDPAGRVLRDLLVHLATHPFENLRRTGIVDHLDRLGGHHAVIDDEGHRHQKDAARDAKEKTHALIHAPQRRTLHDR